VGAFGRLVVDQRLRGVDVTERRMRRHEVLGGVEPEALGEDGAQRLHLHVAEPGEGGDVGAQRIGVRGIGPDTRGVAAVVVPHVHRQIMHPPGHRSREPVNRGLRAEHRLEVGGRERCDIERAEAFTQRQWAGECLLHGDLLVEREADQQRHRIGGDQRIGLVGLGEVEAVGHAAIVSCRECMLPASSKDKSPSSRAAVAVSAG
jgi:hypothetical protein